MVLLCLPGAVKGQRAFASIGLHIMLPPCSSFFHHHMKVAVEKTHIKERVPLKRRGLPAELAFRTRAFVSVATLTLLHEFPVNSGVGSDLLLMILECVFVALTFNQCI